jgi:hypothetical protein
LGLLENDKVAEDESELLDMDTLVEVGSSKEGFDAAV